MFANKKLICAVLVQNMSRYVRQLRIGIFRLLLVQWWALSPTKFINKLVKHFFSSPCSSQCEMDGAIINSQNNTCYLPVCMCTNTGYSRPQPLSNELTTFMQIIKEKKRLKAGLIHSAVISRMGGVGGEGIKVKSSDAKQGGPALLLRMTMMIHT